MIPFDGIIGEKSRDHKYARFSDNKGTQRLIGHRRKVQGRPQICIYLIHRTPIGSQSQTHRGLCNAGEKDARAADDDEGRKEENSAKMLLELLAVLAATCAVLYYRFRRKCTYWYAIINKYMLGSKNPFL